MMTTKEFLEEVSAQGDMLKKITGKEQCAAANLASKMQDLAVEFKRIYSDPERGSFNSNSKIEIPTGTAPRQMMPRAAPERHFPPHNHKTNQ
ncbi:MAG: hypothetical protein ABSA83_11765 [Verrucomicrobiota bacterium]|jgi:hypothetical protein